MSSFVASALILCNVVFATAVFMLLASPKIGARWMHRVMNPREAFWENQLTPEEEERLERLGNRLGGFGLFSLACFSFAVGVYNAILHISS